MTIRFGVSPIAWINDDMPELGGDTPLESVLRGHARHRLRRRRAGRQIPARSGGAGALLGRYDLDLVGGWYSSSLLGARRRRGDRGDAGALDAAPGAWAARCSSSPKPATPYTATAASRSPQSPRLATRRWKQFGERMTTVADYIAGAGPALRLPPPSRHRRRDAPTSLIDSCATRASGRADARHRPRRAGRHRSGAGDPGHPASASPTCIARTSAARSSTRVEARRRQLPRRRARRHVHRSR